MLLAALVRLDIATTVAIDGCGPPLQHGRQAVVHEVRRHAVGDLVQRQVLQGRLRRGRASFMHSREDTTCAQESDPALLTVGIRLACRFGPLTMPLMMIIDRNDISRQQRLQAPPCRQSLSRRGTGR
jgi:hypothetical protein